MKGWVESNKAAVKSFRGATTSQMKRHVKPTTEQNPKNIILHCGTDINDDSDPQNIAEEIVELSKSITKDCNSNAVVSGIAPRPGKLNEKVRSAINRLLRIYCRNMDIRFAGHENINPSEHMNRSGLHLNHLIDQC